MDNCLKISANKTGEKIIFILALFYLLSFSVAFSQNLISKPTRQSALDAFSRGNFEQAYIQFNELSLNYPRDPLYKYYCGVSLVKLEKDPVKASALLKEAQSGSAAIRTIPADVIFYLGRAQQLSGNFGEAIKSYNLFTEQVGKKNAREAQTFQFIQQCNEMKGAIAIVKAADNDEINKDSILKVQNETIIVTGSINSHNPDTIIRNDKPLLSEYEKMLNESLNYQFRADSLLIVADLARKQLESALPAGKSAIKTKISEIEKLAVVNQELASEKMVTSENILNSITGKKVLQERKHKPDSALSLNGIIPLVIQNGSGVRKDTLLEKEEAAANKNIIQNANNKILIDTVNQLVTKGKIPAAQPKPVEMYSIFDVNSKLVYAANEKVKINPDVPEGLIYSIKVGSFRNPLAPSYFKGITPIWGSRNKGTEVTDYYAGMFRKLADASKALVKVKVAGFKDAFVAALYDKKIVSSERAGVLEKEWGNKSFASISARKNSDIPRDTIPPTLMFRVEVIKSQKPITAGQLDNIKRLAGTRGMDIITNSSGQSIYLIGKFITFESAAEYADLLVRNGQKEARVTAYLGRREIPVETAKQLFEKF